MKRRAFLKDLGIGAAGALVVSCIGKSGGNEADTQPVHKNKGPMTMRKNHNSGDSVSILGYGCMRLPSLNADNTPPILIMWIRKN